MFLQAGILEKDDMQDMEDFWKFQETMCRSMEMQAITANQVCNFIQQILYHNQCEKRTFTLYMDRQRQIEIFIGILLQTTLKIWDSPSSCKCDYTDKLNCRHSCKYGILRQHFPKFGLARLDDLVEVLTTITNQTCDCSVHTSLPMHGPSKYIKTPIPSYSSLQKLHQKEESEFYKQNSDYLYVRGVMSWIYSRLFQYITPYTDPSMNKEKGFGKYSVYEFYKSERDFLENRLSILDFDAPITTIWKKIEELADLKRTYCQCQEHKDDRETNLLYQLNMHNSGGNRELVNRVLESRPLGFTALISSCNQIIGTSSQCNLLLYEVKPSKAGTFEVKELQCRPQPHSQMRNSYNDLSGSTMVHVCRHQQEKPSISSLLAQVKGEPEVESASSDLDVEIHPLASFIETVEENDCSDSTSNSGDSSIPDLVESFSSCQIV